MAYPEEIIAEFTKKFKLTPSQQQQLRENLMIEGMHAAVETHKFNPENLIIQLALPEGFYTSVLSPIAARQIITHPTVLTDYTAVVTANSEALKAWDNIKLEIQAIHSLPLHDRRLKQKQTQELYPRILEFLGVYAAIVATNPIFREESLTLPKVLSQYLNVLVEPIKESAEKYFRSLFEKMGRKIIDITFTPKRSGVQLGTTMTIAYKDSEAKEHRITYYIKTHQYGSTSETSSVKPPDPKELFVYKVLEYVGYGLKTHFFFNPLSLGGFFIATQDMVFTKVMGKEKSFMPFERFAESYNTTPVAPQYEEARRALISLDILSRILRLSDTTTNPGNFGRVTVDQERSKWKFLDFRINSEPDVYYLRKEIFEDFCEGNGVYNYDYANFLRYIFRDPTYENSKMGIAHQTMDELHNGKLCLSRESRKMPLSAAIEMAFHEITEYITSNRDALRIDLDTALADLKKYFAAIQENLKILAEGIHKKYVTLAAESGADTTYTPQP